METILVIRPDFAKILLAKKHQIHDISPKRYKNSNQVDWTRCVFHFLKDPTIDEDLKELLNNLECNKSRA
jgi:hypothetical protein